jgi:threonine dehydratase
MTTTTVSTPLVRLGNLFSDREVYAKCEFLSPSGSFKDRGAAHLLTKLSRESTNRLLVVPSMGNTALGAALAAQSFGFSMVGVVPQTISRAKDVKLQALGVELIKVVGGGTDLLNRATQVAQERQGYFVHPHLDADWTDGYQVIAEEIIRALPGCRSLIFPVGGGGLLMGLTEYFLLQPSRASERPQLDSSFSTRDIKRARNDESQRAPLAMIGCEAFNYPTYAKFNHARSKTIADGLVLEVPHAKVQKRIDELKIPIHLVQDADIRKAMRELYDTHGMLVEPSSAVTVAYARGNLEGLEKPSCLVLTGDNITREDFFALIGG